ncbi:hypothetical protein EU245_01885 [Lentibacillus lipolyticus]|nr:hypothetical protein EU245_01885 [Lentibacillus lipolyticus]
MKEDNENVLDELKENDQRTFDQKRARKMVWRTRLSIGFTVLRTLLAIFLLFVLYMIPVNMYYDMSGKQAGFDRMVTTLVETRYPGVEVDETHGHQAEINAFLTQSTTIKVYRNVGEWNVVIGEVEAKKRLFGDVNLTLDFDEKYLNDNMVNRFAVPPKLLGRGNSGGNPDNKEDMKNQIAKIGDGHVAQVQFSTKEAMKPEALLEKLDAYDVHIFRMPVYGGELTEVHDISYGSAGQYTFVPSLLLRPQTVYGENNRSSSSSVALTETVLDDSMQQFYKDMEWLLENGDYNGRDIDEKRLNYIRENGMQVYGAVVTGPIREVEKLMDEEQFHQFRLGGVDVWNWNENQGD